MSTAYISYYDTINDQKVRGIMQHCMQVLAQDKPTRLYFLLSSGGGSVDAGVALYNFLRALPVPITMHNAGSIDSIANVIFLAADERFAVSNGSFLFHGLQWGFGQGAQLTWNQLQEIVSRFRAEEDKMMGIICERTTIPIDELRRMFHQGEAKDLEFAKQRGVIQDVRDARVPEGAPFYALNIP